MVKHKRIATPPETTREATLTRLEKDIQVSPIFPGLESLVSQRGIIGVQNGIVGMNKEWFPLYQVSEHNPKVASIAAGLDAALRLLAARSGVTVQDSGRWPSALPQPNERLLKRAWCAPRSDLLEWIRCKDRGLIVANDSPLMADVIAQVAIAWPNLSISVLGFHLAQLSDIARHFTRSLPTLGLFGMYSGGQVPESRIALCTPAACWQHRDVVIFLDARKAASEEGRQVYMRVKAKRFYGFCDNSRIDNCTEDCIRQVFGFHELNLCDTESRIISFVQIPNDVLGTSIAPASDLDLKKAAIWNNPARNRRISRIAKSLATGNVKGISPAIDDWQQTVGCNGPFIVGIFVENRHHAELLSKIDLGGASVFVGDMFDPEEAAKLDVLVRADGLMGTPKVLTETLDRVKSCKFRAKPFLIVDIADRTHPVLRRWKKKRYADYRERGILQALHETFEGRVSDWLDRRPSHGRAAS